MNPEWMGDPRFKNRILMAMEHADELDSLVQVWLLDHTKEEVFAICREQQITFAPVRDIAEVARDPHFEERGYYVEIERSPTGMLRYPGAPYQLSETPWRMDQPAPLLGEHNEEIYCGRLGYSRDDLEQLHANGVI